MTMNPIHTTDWIAGVDLGGTKMAVTLANRTGIVCKLQAPVVTTGAPTALAEQAWDLIAQLCTQQGLARSEVSAVGILTCSPFVKVRQADGNVMREVAAPNLCGGMAGNPYGLANDWKHFPLESYFVDKVPRVVMENDGVAILAAERTFGALRGSDHCAYATWSTGVGFGLCVDGKLLAGKRGNAGHGGHMFVSEDRSTQCGCGNAGDLEAQISGKALARLWQIATNNPAATTQDLFSAASQNNTSAVEIIKQAASRMGAALYNLTVILDLERIALGGSVFMHHQALLLPMLQAQLQRGMGALTQGVELVPTALGDHAGDLGALSLVIPADWVAGFKASL